MNRFLALGLTSLWLIPWILGCSSKTEVASAPPQPVPVASAPPPAAAAPSNDDADSEVTNSDEDSSGDSTDDTSGDDGTGDVTDSETMNEDDAPMNADDAGAGDADDPSMVVARAKPKNLREQAEQAFSDGLEKAAYRLIQGHILSSSTDAAELLEHIRWSPSRRQPQLGARIAVGIDLKAPSEISRDFKPIGSLKGFFSNRKTSTRRGFQERGEPAPATDVSAVFYTPNDRERILQKYTGLMGDVLVDHLRTTHAEGQWAPVFKSLTGVIKEQQRQVMNGDGFDDGSLTTDDTTDGSEMAQPARAELWTKIEGDEAKYISVGPILTYIGTGSINELLDQAKIGAFDALIVYDVDVTINMRAKMIYNECRAKLMNFADGKIVVASKLLKNTESQKEIDKSGMSFVVTAMQPLLTKLDETVALKEIPPVLTPELIKEKRLPPLLADTARPKLDTLTEIRFYREKGLLDDADVSLAFETLLGPEDGKLLLNGTDEERLRVVKKLLGVEVEAAK